MVTIIISYMRVYEARIIYSILNLFLYPLTYNTLASSSTNTLVSGLKCGEFP